MTKSAILSVKSQSFTVALFSLSIFLQAQSDVLKIGILLPQNREEGTNIILGAETAVNEFNKRYNLRASLIIKQHLNQWGQEADEAVEMLFSDGALGIIAPPDGVATHLAFQVAGRTRKPMISLCSDTSITGATIPWCLRITPSSFDEIKTVFNYLNTKLTLRNSKWLLIAQSGRTEREVENDAKKAAALFGVNVEETIGFDFKKEISKEEIKKKIGSALKVKPDGIFICLQPDYAAEIVREIRSLNSQVLIVGSGRLFSEKFILLAGNYSNDIIVPTVKFGFVPENSDYTVDFLKLDTAQRDYISIMSRDAAAVLLEHFRKCDPDRPHLNFPGDVNLIGWTGELKFDKTGDRILKNLIVWKIHNRKFILTTD
ncbi:MAG: ABC transporter substrate-binding protein [Verrucomicrobiia bacterium]